MGLDELVLRSINRWAADPVVGWLAEALSSRWMIVAVCLPLTVALVRAGRFRSIVAIALAMAVGDVATARVLKPAFDRPRPCTIQTDLVARVPCGSGRSFPSGHATVAFAFLLAAAPSVRRGWWLAWVAVAVAGSRVVLGVHYPSDVIAGGVVGGIIGHSSRWLLGVKTPTRPRETDPSDSSDEGRPAR